MGSALILQSYRTRNVPRWIARCMESVSAWARASGHAYEFVGDELFELVPAWYRERCGSELLPQTDLARLLLMRDRLKRGAQRAVWIDADVIVFAPESIGLQAVRGYAFCRETWVNRGPDGRAFALTRVNNAVTVMDAGNAFLDFYIHACETVIAGRPAGQVDRLEAGTSFLTRLYGVYAFPLIDCVGVLSPALVREVSSGGGPLSTFYAQATGRPIGAANLCASLAGMAIGEVVLAEDDFDRAIEVLCRTRGGVVNDHLSGVR